MLQKRATRILNNVGGYEHANPLFYRSHVIQFNDLVCYKIMQIMYRVKAKTLQTVDTFVFNTCKYELRDVCKFTVQNANKRIKKRCISIVGVQLYIYIYNNYILRVISVIEMIVYGRCVWMYIYIYIYTYIYTHIYIYFLIFYIVLIIFLYFILIFWFIWL